MDPHSGGLKEANWTDWKSSRRHSSKQFSEFALHVQYVFIGKGTKPLISSIILLSMSHGGMLRLTSKSNGVLTSFFKANFMGNYFHLLANAFDEKM